MSINKISRQPPYRDRSVLARDGAPLSAHSRRTRAPQRAWGWASCAVMSTALDRARAGARASTARSDRIQPNRPPFRLRALPCTILVLVPVCGYVGKSVCGILRSKNSDAQRPASAVDRGAGVRAARKGSWRAIRPFGRCTIESNKWRTRSATIAASPAATAITAVPTTTSASDARWWLFRHAPRGADIPALRGRVS